MGWSEAANLAVPQSGDAEGVALSHDGDRPDLAAAACGDRLLEEPAERAAAHSRGRLREAHAYLPRHSCRIAGSIGYALVNWDP